MNEHMIRYYHRMPHSIQTLGINLFEWKAWNIHRSRKFFDFFALLQETEKWNNDQFEAYQNKHLRKMVEYAYNHVPFYRELYDGHGIDVNRIRTREDMEKLPIITKEDISSHYHRLISRLEKHPVVMSTGGTTGTPLKFLVSHDLDVLNYALTCRRNVWAGYKKNSLIARFVGDNPVKDCSDKFLFRRSYLMNRLIFPSYCLSIDHLPRMFEILKKYRLKYIQSYPSTAYILARYLEFEDTTFDLDALFYSSEPMYEHQRELIEQRFNTKLFGFYGQAERVVSATECAENRYHLTMIDGITEIVRNGDVVHDGERGLTVVTSLHNYAMPFIRYALNDFTGYSGDSCNCGRTLPAIYNVDTRLGDFIVSQKGVIYPPAPFTLLLKNVPNIAESQLIQEDIDRLSINIVKMEKFSETDYLNLRDSFEKMLGREFELEINYVKEIPHTDMFKRRFVVNRLGGDYIEKAFTRE